MGFNVFESMKIGLASPEQIRAVRKRTGSVTAESIRESVLRARYAKSAALR